MNVVGVISYVATSMQMNWIGVARVETTCTFLFIRHQQRVSPAPPDATKVFCTELFSECYAFKIKHCLSSNSTESHGKSYKSKQEYRRLNTQGSEAVLKAFQSHWNLHVTYGTT